MTDISALKKWKFAQDVPSLQQVVDELHVSIPQSKHQTLSHAHGGL
jgi:hypothetical protein